MPARNAWEYKITSQRVENAEARLNEYGKDGWEVIAAHFTMPGDPQSTSPTGVLHAILKRQVARRQEPLLT